MFYLRLITLFFISTVNVSAITLIQTVPNEVLFNLTTNAPTDAGSYFADGYTSSANATLLSISDIPNDTTWSVYARLSQDIPGIKVRIKRSGDGTGIKKPTGNTSNRILSTNLIKLFKGQGSITNIPMQTEIYGIGVSDGHGEFTTNIEFTVETTNQ